jgi:hypothetical protein
MTAVDIAMPTPTDNANSKVNPDRDLNDHIVLGVV